MKLIQRDAATGYLDRWLWCPKHLVNETAVKSALTHALADSYSQQERVLYLWGETRDHLLVPRAFWSPESLPFRVVDCRPTKYPFVDFKCSIKLDHRPKRENGKIVLKPTGDNVQQLSTRTLMTNPGGVLQLACGKGKTFCCLYTIAQSKAPALVMLDNLGLLYQWYEEVNKVLDVPGGVGIFGDGKKQWKHGLVLATYHSVANWYDTIPEEARRHFKTVWWDEGHHVGAPTFATTASMFYGNRYALTATPEREDGMHVITSAHIGPVLHKDLTPTMTPSFGFLWSGFSLDLMDPVVQRACCDTNGEVHMSKVTGYLGQYRPRLQKLIEVVQLADTEQRTTILLSNSVDEVVNLMAMYEGYAAQHGLYTDILLPTPQDVGETQQPKQLTKKDVNRLSRQRTAAQAHIKKGGLTPAKNREVQAQLAWIDQEFKKDEVYKKIKSKHDSLRKKYIKGLVTVSRSSGLLTYEVPTETRQKMLKDRRVIFAVTKYGKEGLDCPRLDTVILSSLFSNRGSLQQLMGRPTRPMPGKREPVLIAVVDNIGQSIGMSRKLINHLHAWPADEGGPFKPLYIDYPDSWTIRKSKCDLKTLLGPSSAPAP